MIGTFTTTQYDSRDSFEERRPSGILVSRNRFTLAGMEWMWQMMTGQLRDADGTLTDALSQARIVVGNGTQDFSFADVRLQGGETAQAPVTSMAQERRNLGPDDMPDSVELVLLATFGENDAAFEWQERGVVTNQGVLIDRAVSDQGRKVMGAVWQLEARLTLTGTG